MLENPEKHPWDIISENNWFEDKDENEVEVIVDEVLISNPKEYERLKNGEQKLMGFFIGIIRKKAEDKADANLIKEILLKKIA
jgi:aspartyl-tRNA(Asn)/glutamyl-tRNA(Gln) amidotransferase subunit B